jgi:hypothetical protein
MESSDITEPISVTGTLLFSRYPTIKRRNPPPPVAKNNMMTRQVMNAFHGEDMRSPKFIFEEEAI